MEDKTILEFLEENAGNSAIKLDEEYLVNISVKTMAMMCEECKDFASASFLSKLCSELMTYGEENNVKEISVEDYINYFLKGKFYTTKNVDDHKIKSMFYETHFMFLSFAFKFLCVHQNLPQLFEEAIKNNKEKEEE